MKELTLYIPRKVYQQIMYWVNKSSFEVSGFGTISFNPNLGQFVVQKVFLATQENSSAETEMSANGINDLLYDTRDEPHELRFWFHSHVNMDVFWSGTDKKAIKQLAEHGWFVSTVFNKKEEMLTCFAQGKAEVPLIIDNLETIVYDPVFDNEIEAWDAEYKEKVTERKYKLFGKKASKKDADDEIKSFFDLLDAEDISELRKANYPIKTSFIDDDLIEEPVSFGDKMIIDQIKRNEEAKKALAEEEDDSVTVYPTKEKRILPLKKKASLKKKVG